MGSRGPLRVSTSVRGQKERSERAAFTTVGTLKAPAWLPKASRATWRRVVFGLTEAHVPLEKIDGEAIAFFCITIDSARDAAAKGDAKLLARLGRDLIAWSNLIGATPAARARIGVKQPESKQRSGSTLNGQWIP